MQKEISTEKKSFYKMVLLIAVPIMIQNGITTFVSLLDNIMIGQIGTSSMSGVSIVNQILNVYNIGIFGLVSGAGIFSAQFFGSGDEKGFKEAMRFKVLSGLVVSILVIFLFFFNGEFLISLFINDSDAVMRKETLEAGINYLSIMSIQIIPFTIIQAYSSSLRERGETIVPMISGIAAVGVNMMLNWVLIFGKLGFPVLGVKGAAIATVISRFVELTVVVLWAHLSKKQKIFSKGLYTSFYISKSLIKKILITGAPLMLNEILWAGGQAVIMGGYSLRGLTTVAAFNISSTLSGLFNVVFIALGNAISIIVGQLLGAKKFKEAKSTATRLIIFSTFTCVGVGLILACFSPFFPKLYNTTDDVRNLATVFLLIASLFLPSYSFMNATYFTLRSGGKTLITFLFDSVFVWVVSIPLCYLLVNFTLLPVAVIYFICQASELIKCVIGYVLVKKGVWINNIVSEN
ncbi:MAG: MATE family efflux transporter [Lachnospiraceae bacterium]|nr:MATE family efflux transporter [Lachnospiraceae bacterium]